MEEIKTDQEKIWLTVFEENYPFMRSLIERTLGELRYKDFVDCMDLVVDLAVSKERERIVEGIVNETLKLDKLRPFGQSQGNVGYLRGLYSLKDAIINLINTK